jgi:uncharacterized protein YdhG (YjbR/CyaY superfamily)
MARAQKPSSISEYISAAPKQARARLREMRALIAAAAPGATQTLKWGMPSFSLQRILVTFAGFREHISLFPTPAAIRAFRQELVKYQTSSATIQFPLDRPLPKGLIRRIVALRVKQVRAQDAKWRTP